MRVVMKSEFARFAMDESGATAIEYGLIGALISIAIITGATQVGTNVGALFNSVATQVNTVIAN